MPHGGKRPGAGRKSWVQLLPKQEYEELLANRRAYLMELSEKTQVYIGKMQELADGIWVEKEYPQKDGTVKTRIYKREPDMRAVAYLLDHQLGRASTPAEDTVNAARVRQYEANTKMIDLQTTVFSLSLIQQKDVAEAMRWLCSEFIGYWQAIPAENMPNTQESKAAEMIRFNEKMQEVLWQALERISPQGKVIAIGPGEEEADVPGDE